MFQPSVDGAAMCCRISQPPCVSGLVGPTGHIVAYSAETDAYLVAYSGSEPVIAWEQALRLSLGIPG